MPGIRRLRESGISVIYSGKNEAVTYCQRCLEMFNIRSKLGNRVYMPDSSGYTNIPPDYDQWRQCHLCGSIYGRYEVKQEADISTITEPRSNPFKFKSGQVETGESRKFDRSGKTQRKRKLKTDVEQYKEE